METAEKAADPPIIDHEKERLEIQRETLKLERAKTRLMTVAIVVPVVAALLASLSSLYVQREQARLAFELKSVEMVLSARDGNEAMSRALALREMFPDRVPGDLVQAVRFHVTMQDLKDHPESKSALVAEEIRREMAAASASASASASVSAQMAGK